MKRKSLFALVAILVTIGAIAAGLGMSRAQAAPKLTKVTLQLKWVTQAQFAGYYAAVAQGYYKKLGLDVTLKVGGPDITPEQTVLAGQAEFGIDWLPNLFATREKGGKIVSVAQVFGRSGMTELTWKSSVNWFGNARSRNWMIRSLSFAVGCGLPTCHRWKDQTTICGCFATS